MKSLLTERVFKVVQQQNAEKTPDFNRNFAALFFCGKRHSRPWINVIDKSLKHGTKAERAGDFLSYIALPQRHEVRLRGLNANVPPLTDLSISLALADNNTIGVMGDDPTLADKRVANLRMKFIFCGHDAIIP